MPDRQQDRPSSSARAPLEPGVRAARERLGLTQEQAAELLNVSVHTFRGWDQGRHRPGNPEQVQLLVSLLKTPIEVLWPPRDNPQVAHASALGTPKRSGGPRSSSVDDLRDPQVSGLPTSGGAHGGGPTMIDGSRAAEAHARTATQSPSATRPTDGRMHGLDRKGGDQGGGIHAVSAADASPSAGEGPLDDWDQTGVAQGLPASAGAEVRTLGGTGPRGGLSARHVSVALVAAGALGLGAMVAASAVGDRQTGSGGTPATSAVSSPADQERQAEAARRESKARMVAAEQRGDYDAAIRLAQQLNDQGALEGYRQTAAKVLVGRAERAAARGDVSRARSHLRLARSRYETAPGAGAVNARIRRIERDRRQRAERQRRAARERPAARTSVAPPVATPSAPPVAPAAPPSQPDLSPAPQTNAPREPSTREPEQTVDPGLF